MAEEDTGADSVEQRRHRIGNDAGVVGPGIGRDRAEELVQRFRLAVELDVVEEVRPFAEPELIEKELIIGCGFDRRGDGAVAGTSATRLIDEIDWEAAAQEEGLEALAPVRRRLPAPRGLVGAVQHDDRK